MGYLKATEVEVPFVKDDEVSVFEWLDLDGDVACEVKCAEIRVKEYIVVARNDAGGQADVFPGEALAVGGGGRRRGLGLRGARRRRAARHAHVVGRTREGGDERDADDDEAEDADDDGGRALAADELLAAVRRVGLVHVALPCPSMPWEEENSRWIENRKTRFKKKMDDCPTTRWPMSILGLLLLLVFVLFWSWRSWGRINQQIESFSMSCLFICARVGAW